MTHDRRRLGDRGENAAARHLRRQGFRILHRNYTCTLGEIDIVARKLDLLVFAEVKTRRSDATLPPEANVTPDKQQRIAHLADHYIRRYRLEHLQPRFDVLAVVMESPRKTRITHHPGAFGAPGG